MEELLELTGELEQLEYPSSEGEESSWRWMRRMITMAVMLLLMSMVLAVELMGDDDKS